MHKFWVLLFDGNCWLPYAKEDSFQKAQETVVELSAKWERVEIALILT